jgi:hypothetical protein
MELHGKRKNNQGTPDRSKNSSALLLSTCITPNIKATSTTLQQLHTRDHPVPPLGHLRSAAPLGKSWGLAGFSCETLKRRDEKREGGDKNEPVPFAWIPVDEGKVVFFTEGSFL